MNVTEKNFVVFRLLDGVSSKKWQKSDCHMTWVNTYNLISNEQAACQLMCFSNSAKDNRYFGVRSLSPVQYLV